MRIRWMAVLVFALPACSSDGNGGTGFGTGGVSGNAGTPAGAAGSGATPSGAPGSGGASSTGSTGGLTSGGGSAGGNSSIGGPGNGGTPNGGASSGGGNVAGAAGAPSGGASAGGGGVSSSGGAANTGGSSSGSGGASGTWWRPSKNATFYWDLQNAPPDNTRNVGAYDIDGWGNDAQEISALHARGIKVVCYMDAGTYEPGRPDSSDFPASLKGAAVQGWPGELWLDVRSSGPNYAKLQSIMLARFKVCQQKGFDAVEPDNLDSYQNDPGFKTAAADQLAYNEWLATTVHGLGLAIFQKNDLDQVQALEPYFDGILDEECNKYTECDALAPYTAAGKPAWDAEYTEDGETTNKFCDADIKANIEGALFGLDLDGSLFQPCSNDVGIMN
jgi:hypothetical protein